MGNRRKIIQKKVCFVGFALVGATGLDKYPGGGKSSMKWRNSRKEFNILLEFIKICKFIKVLLKSLIIIIKPNI